MRLAFSEVAFCHKQQRIVVRVTSVGRSLEIWAGLSVLFCIVSKLAGYEVELTDVLSRDLAAFEHHLHAL